MMEFVLIVMLGLTPQTFTTLSFCREAPRPSDPMYCIDLSSTGEGVFRIESDDPDEALEEALVLSETARLRFLELVEDTDYLMDGDRYEASTGGAANVGRKRFVIEGDWGTRTAEFNYASRGEAVRLTTFMEGLILQQEMVFDVEFAMQFDRLNLPTVLERLDEGIGARQFSDPEVFLGMLRDIAESSRYMNLARTAARDILEEIDSR